MSAEIWDNPDILIEKILSEKIRWVANQPQSDELCAKLTTDD